MKRIPYEESAKAYMGADYDPSFGLVKRVKHGIECVAQAQLESCEKEAREIFEEMEEYFKTPSATTFLLPHQNGWQALKKKYLGGE